MDQFNRELQNLTSSKFNLDLLIEILEKTFELKDITITNVKCDLSTKKGESYLSTSGFCQVFAKGKDSVGNEKEVILPIFTKKPPVNIARLKTFRCLEFFENEAIFYNQVWPALNSFQKSKKPKVLFEDVPLCISAVADGENDYIALENLSSRGFIGACKSGGLDLNHTRLIMKLFAQFHALSFAFKLEHPKSFEEIAGSLKETYFSEKQRKWYAGFTKTLLRVTRDAVEKELSSLYVKKFDTVTAGDFFGKIIKICENRGTFSVITHGDAWIPNFLIKYDADNITPLRAIMIDFQLARYAPLALDILFFLYSCTDQSLRVQYWDTLIEEYHQHFVDMLKNLGSNPNILSLETLKAEIKSNIVFGIGMSMEAIIMSLLDEDEVADVDSIPGNQEVPLESVWIVHPFKSSEKRQRLSGMFKHAVDNEFI